MKSMLSVQVLPWRIGVKFLLIRMLSPEAREAYDKGRGIKPDGTVEIPMALSIAEPTKVGG